MEQDTLDVQGLRILKAFYGIKDPEARQIILLIVEAAARGAKLEAHHYIGLLDGKGLN